MDLVWTHDGLSVSFGFSRGVSCLANNSLCPLSLTTLTTLSFGTDWYLIVALELVCQNSRPASTCKDHHVIHQSRWYVHSTWVTLDCTNISLFSIFIFTDFEYCLDASKIKAMEPILVCRFLFKLTSESSFHYRKKHSNASLHLFLVRLGHGVEPYLWHTWRCEFQRIPFAFLVSWSKGPNSVLSKDPFLFCSWTLSSDVLTQDCCCRRCCRCCFSRRPGFTRIVETTVSRFTLEGSIFVLTLFESCEPCPWFTTAGLEDSKHTSLRLSSFARNEEL